MKDELIFQTNAQFESVMPEKSATSWHFAFAGKIGLATEGLWRLLENGEIKFVSDDDGHQFGLPKPLDLVGELTKKLSGKSLLEIKVERDTSDLILSLTSGIQLEVFISSGGYETYNFSLENKNYIGMGSGGVTIIPDTKN